MTLAYVIQVAVNGKVPKRWSHVVSVRVSRFGFEALASVRGLPWYVVLDTELEGIESVPIDSNGRPARPRN